MRHLLVFCILLIAADIHAAEPQTLIVSVEPDCIDQIASALRARQWTVEKRSEDSLSASLSVDEIRLATKVDIFYQDDAFHYQAESTQTIRNSSPGAAPGGWKTVSVPTQPDLIGDLRADVAHMCHRVTAAAAGPGQSLEDRLNELGRLRQSELITEAEYKALRKRALKMN